MTPQEHIDRRTLFTVAYHDYEAALMTHAFFRMHDQAMSKDLVQNVFVKTWKYLAERGEILRMKSFLYHVLNDLIVDEYRKKKTVSLDFLLEQGFDVVTNHTDRLYDRIDGAQVALLIKELPAPYCRIMTMRYVEDFSIQEISRATGKTPNTVAVQAYRVLEKLKNLCRFR